MLDTPVDYCNEIECLEGYISPDDYNLSEPGSSTQVSSGVTHHEEEEASKRLVSQRPAKRGLCYRCHKGNRFTTKEACLVCDAKYCSGCIIRAMGSMPEGRKCLTCIGFPVDDLKRPVLGKCSRVLKGLFRDEEVKQIMNAEVSCAANQLPPECIYVNGSPLCKDELLALRICSNAPKNLKPGNYWYDKISGFWGKEGHKPCQIITPLLDVGSRMKSDASSGNTNVFMNDREITKAELWMLRSAGFQSAGNPYWWLQADGTYQEEGMNRVKGKIWGRKRTKFLCSLLSLPTPESPNPRGQSNNVNEGGVPIYLEQRAFCKVLLVGNDRSGTSTIYKQARVLYDNPFSEAERLSIKSMIQSDLYRYLARLLEGREQFEEESLLKKRKGKYTDQLGPSDSKSVTQAMTDYTLGQKLKGFSEWLINVMVSGNLETNFPAATREYAPFVEDLWKDAAIQATYSRKDELDLPRVASYFLDRAVEIAKVNYEPSDTDILYAEGITSSDGLSSMEFSFSQSANDCFTDPADQPDPVTRYHLIRVHAKSLGENCKWLEMFEDVGIILFCVSLTEYDEYEVDRNGQLINKMLQSKKLFESIVTHPAFEETNVLLILNKFDLFEEMIEKVPLTHCEWFEDCNPMLRRSGNTIAPLAQRAFQYIAVKFKKLFETKPGRRLYVCPVTGLESDTVESALRYAREIVKWEDDKLSFRLIGSSSESIQTDTSSYLDL